MDGPARHARADDSQKGLAIEGPPLLIHPGFHKTATTWLQKTVFADPRVFRNLLTHEDVDAIFLQPRDGEYDPDAACAEIERRRAGAVPGQAEVISSEILSGNILYGARDRSAIADRLAALAMPAKILLTVRAQRPIAKSIYTQYVKRGGRLGLTEYLSFQPEPGFFWFEPEMLDFGSLAQIYADRFGAQNVLVLPQELLRKDSKAYLRHLFAFVGIDRPDALDELARAREHGVSPPASGLGLIRLANAFRGSPINPSSSRGMNLAGQALQSLGYRWTFGKDRADREMNALLSQALAGKYGASNAVLQRFSPFDLASLGYDMDQSGS